MDPMALFGLGTEVLNTGIGLYDRWRFLQSRLIEEGAESAVDEYNWLHGASPYGSPHTSWGGMFGFQPDGQPVGYGHAQAQYIRDLMGVDPTMGTQWGYQQLAQQQRPGMADETAGLAGLLGRDGAFSQAYDSPLFAPQFSQMPDVAGQGGMLPQQSPAPGLRFTGDPTGTLMESLPEWLREWMGGGGGVGEPETPLDRAREHYGGILGDWASNYGPTRILQNILNPLGGVSDYFGHVLGIPGGLSGWEQFTPWGRAQNTGMNNLGQPWGTKELPGAEGSGVAGQAQNVGSAWFDPGDGSGGVPAYFGASGTTGWREHEAVLQCVCGRLERRRLLSGGFCGSQRPAWRR